MKLKMSIDRYERYVAVCCDEDKDINKAMVKSGWALALKHKQYSDSSYAKGEEAAKLKKLGVWNSTCFIPPWQWRRGKRCLDN